MSDDIAIKVEHVSKDFLLPHERTQSVKTAFVNALKGRRNKTTEKQHALRDISFEVKKGEFFGIVGRNGSGKSTLLKILAQIYQPTKGSVSVKGRLVPFIELGVGFNPELTGRDNIYLSASLMGFSEKEIDAMYDDIVEFAELEKFMDQKLKNYSSGMQVRLAFSVAVQADADILLIDEVLAVGDTSFQRKCFEYFKSLKKLQKTVVFVSHDMNAIREYCDKAILINDGKLAAKGNVDNVTASYSQLFTNAAKGTEKAALANSQRWGTGDAHTASVTVEVSDKEVVILHEVYTKKDLHNPVIGVRIRDGTSRDITGTNTLLEGRTIQLFPKNTTLTLQWSLPNVFSDGDYVVDPSVVSETQETLDWWNEAAKISIKKTRRLPYPLDPGFKVSIR